MPKKMSVDPRQIIQASLRRTWATLPDDALISRYDIARLAGVHLRTIQRHIERGQLNGDHQIKKSTVIRWLEQFGRHLRRGRPRKVA